MDNLTPSRQLDALIAEKVFGQTVVDHKDFARTDKFSKNKDGSLTLVPQYSMHIASAWMVVEKFTLAEIVSSGDGGWVAILGSSSNQGHAKTAPHAICLAALEALATSTE